MENKKLLRWPRLVLGTVVLLFAGIIYAWSILKVPFEDFWDAGQLGFNYTVTIIFFCLGGLLSGFLSKKTTSAFRLIISAVLLLSGFFIASRLIGGDGGSVALLYLAYGVISGIGIGFVYNTVVSTTNAWYADKVGHSSGILLAGFGLGSLLVGRVADMLGNAEAVGWRNAYVIIAISLCVIMFAAAFIVKPPPAGTIFPASKSAGMALSQGQAKDYSVREMLRRPTFYKLFIYISFISATGSAAISFARDIALDVGASPGFAVTVVGMLAVANALGRFCAGWLFDNVSMRKTQIIISLIALLAPVTVVAALMTDSLFLGVTGVCLCGFALGQSPATGSVLIAGFYGQKNFSLNFSVINLVLIPAPFAATMAGRLKDSTGAFLTAFMILTAISLIGAISNISIKNP